MKIVLIGASNNKEKYGNKILNNLVSKGYSVFPVNPKEKEIEGIKCYNDLGLFLDKNIDYDIINFVVRPEIVLYMLEINLEKIKNKTIWCQPGASNDEVKNFLEKNGFQNYITDSCIMLENITKNF